MMESIIIASHHCLISLIVMNTLEHLQNLVYLVEFIFMDKHDFLVTQIELEEAKMEARTKEETKEKKKEERKGELEAKIELLDPPTKTKIVEIKLDK